jgi:hypothetical protein
VTETAIGLVRALAACPSTTRRSLLGALAFVCALVGPIAVRAEVVSAPSADPPNSEASLPLPTVLRGPPPSTAEPVAVGAEVVSAPSTDTPNSEASLPLPTVLRGPPPSTLRSVPICPPGYTLSPDYGSGCVGPGGGDYTEDQQSLASGTTAWKRAMARWMAATMGRGGGG